MHLEAIVHAHAAAFIGREPWDVAHDEALLADAHRTAWECYRHRQVVVGIDVASAEAEAWGAALEPAADDPARFVAVSSRVSDLAALRELPELDPVSSVRLGIALAAARRVRAAIPATVALPVAGPWATAALLLGEKNLRCALDENPEAVRDALIAIVRKMRPWLRAISSEGLRIVVAEAPYSPAAIPAETLAAFIKPALAAIVHESRAATMHAPALFVEGDTAAIANHLCSTGAGLVVCPATTNHKVFLENTRGFRETTVRVDLPAELWTEATAWSDVCDAVADASTAARQHAKPMLGTGPLPPHASSVRVVDACTFATTMDPWLDRPGVASVAAAGARAVTECAAPSRP